MAEPRDTELVLAPGTYAYVLDGTKGNVSVYCGPYKSSLSNTDQLVVYNPKTSRFDPIQRQQDAIQINVVCPKGSYVVLDNPARTHPDPGKADVMPIGTLQYGRTENIAGPQSFPLWPGQVANVVKGHHLRSNQYLMVRVYDDEAAQANWDKSVVKRVTSTPTPIVSQTATGSEPEVNSSVLDDIDIAGLVTGQQIIIKGTDVAFYIPPTGVEVLKDINQEYVRNAVTLERLEYSILLDESGNKIYKRGPDVVFPTPTQQFFIRSITDESGISRDQRKFRAFELQPTNGIHIKVIADYTDDDEIVHKAGDEIFITGADMPIYYPREEHAIISYGGSEKSYAVAIPAGEGRYVLDRQSGDIDLVTGPRMFLPNPIKQVIVRRILSNSECALYYPGNADVLNFNRELRNKGIDVSSDPAVMNAAIARTITPARAEMAATRNAFADNLARSTLYTPPRMITLNTKFEGAVRIEVFSGFAVQVVNSKGERRTIIGPQTVLLGYDEKLERLSLSKGTPKNDDTRLDTPYLRYVSNSVSDIITLKTKDLVNVDVRVKYMVRFELDKSHLWFSVDNYVRYMVDHLRSLIGNRVRSITMQEFYSNATTILRDLVLGTKVTDDARPLKHFDENGMTIYDLELISVVVQDRMIADMLARAGQETLSETVQVERAQARVEFTRGQQAAARQILDEEALTEAKRAELAEAAQQTAHEARMAAVLQEQARLRETEANRLITAQSKEAIEKINLLIATEQRELDERILDSDAKRDTESEREQAVAQKVRVEAITPALIEAMIAMAQTGQLEAIAQHLAPLALVRGESLSGTFEQIFVGTPLETMITNLKNLSKIGKTVTVKAS